MDRYFAVSDPRKTDLSLPRRSTMAEAAHFENDLPCFLGLVPRNGLLKDGQACRLEITLVRSPMLGPSGPREAGRNAGRPERGGLLPIGDPIDLWRPRVGSSVQA